MDEPVMSWATLLHPDMDSIKRRDEFLSNSPDYIQNEDGSIVAEIEVTLENTSLNSTLNRRKHHGNQ